MLLAIVATAATIASKFGSALIGASAIGPIVHQFIVGAFNGSKEPSKLLLSSTDEKSCVTVSKDEQSGVAETLVEVSESNGVVQNVSGAMIQYKPISETQIEVSESEEIVQPIPLAIVQYASSNVVVDLSNKSSEKSCDTLIEELSSAMIIIMSFAAWYRSRIFTMLQSAMKMFLGTAHGCTQQKEFTEASHVIQMKICLLVISAINRWKEIIHSLFGPPMLIEAEAQLHCDLLTAETALTSVTQLLAMMFAAANGVCHAIQIKICLFTASAINRKEIICPCSNASALLAPLLPIGAEVKVQQTALNNILQHLVVLFAVVKGVLLGYKPSSSSHFPGMKQFASMFLVLLIGVLTLSASWGIHPIISRSSISLYDTTGLENLVDLAASSSNTVSSGLPDASFLTGAVLFNDDHLSTEPARSGLLDTQSLLTAFESNEDLMTLNSGLLDEDDQILSTFGWSGYDDGLLSQTDLYQGDVASTALSLDWDAFYCIHLIRSMTVSGAAHSSLSMICTLDLAQAHVGAGSCQSFVSTHYFTVAVVKQLDIYTVTAIVVDSRISSFDPYDLLSLELPAYSPLSSGAEETSNAPMFAELDTSEEGTPYVSESNGELAELSLHEDLLLQLPDGSSSSSSTPCLSWNSASYEISASVQTEVAISSVLVYEPDPFTLALWLPQPASSLIKASNILNTWELRRLVFMMLLIVVCRDSDTNSDIDVISKGLPTTSQDTLEDEASFDDHGNEAEESLTTVFHKQKQAVSRESTALRSDLGRHWNSSPKRRCRRSPRKRREVTRYQPM